MDDVPDSGEVQKEESSKQDQEGNHKLHIACGRADKKEKYRPPYAYATDLADSRLCDDAVGEAGTF